MGGLADVIIGAIFGARFGFRFFRIKIILFPLSPLTVLRYCPASDVYHLCWDSVLVFSDYRAKKMQCSCMKTDFELASVFVDRVQLIARSRSLALRMTLWRRRNRPIIKSKPFIVRFLSGRTYARLSVDRLGGHCRVAIPARRRRRRLS